MKWFISEHKQSDCIRHNQCGSYNNSRSILPLPARRM
jgi:hypothetical protein